MTSGGGSIGTNEAGADDGETADGFGVGVGSDRPTVSAGDGFAAGSPVHAASAMASDAATSLERGSRRIGCLDSSFERMLAAANSRHCPGVVRNDDTEWSMSPDAKE